MLNIQSTLRTAPHLVKMLHSRYYLVARVIHILSLRSQVCVYIHIFLIIWRRWSGKRKKKITRAVNAACQGSLSASHSGYASHSFVSPALVQSYLLHLLPFPILHSFNLRRLIKYDYSNDTTSWWGVSSKHWFLWHGTAHISVLRHVRGGF